ncbi:MAG: protein phosphatase 2C domain-containing protein [Anaerolineae bacterium]
MTEDQFPADTTGSDPADTQPERPEDFPLELDEAENGEELPLQEGLTPLMRNGDLRPGTTNILPDLQERLLRPTPRIVFGHGRDIGLIRSNNEDATLVFAATQQNVQDNPDLSVFIVADGAGGHEDGERASSLACQVVLNTIMENLYVPMLRLNVDPEGAKPVPPVTEVLVEAYERADQQVRKEVPGGGTTLTTVVLIGDLAHIAHVGDSRAYLIRRGDGEPEFEQLTRDHSVAKRLQEIGQITAAEALHHPEASRLWKIVGLTDHLEPDINTRRLPDDCHLVLCSDGLWNMVPEGNIVEIVLNAPHPQAAVGQLLAAANASGGVDNIAAVVVRIP